MSLGESNIEINWLSRGIARGRQRATNCITVGSPRLSRPSAFGTPIRIASVNQTRGNSPDGDARELRAAADRCYLCNQQPLTTHVIPSSLQYGSGASSGIPTSSPSILGLYVWIDGRSSLELTHESHRVWVPISRQRRAMNSH